MERPDRTFYEALTTLTVVGTVTTRIGLGTAALIPFRHPLVLAQTVASMTHLVGPRLILGLGVGAFDHEFAAVGLGGRPARPPPRSRREPAAGHDRERRHVPATAPSSSSA